VKEICDYFNIQFDITIDKGKAFSYTIDLFYPNYFMQQSKNFQYNAYELTISEMANAFTKTVESGDDVTVETKATEVLRNKYNLRDGFVVNNENVIYLKIIFIFKYLFIIENIRTKFEDKFFYFRNIH
jgi:hypothetical protein